MSPVVQSAHHEYLLVIELTGPGRLAGQSLLAVPIQANDSVVEHRVPSLLLHIVRTNLEKHSFLQKKNTILKMCKSFMCIRFWQETFNNISVPRANANKRLKRWEAETMEIIQTSFIIRQPDNNNGDWMLTFLPQNWKEPGTETCSDLSLTLGRHTLSHPPWKYLFCYFFLFK